MRDRLELPRLSLAERDRRWAAARSEMDKRGLDCLVLWGWPAMWDFCTANARYLCPVGGNSEHNVLVFPRNGDPTCFVLMPTFLEGWRAAQDWVAHIRARHPVLWRRHPCPALHRGLLCRCAHRRAWPYRWSYWHRWARRTSRSGRLAAAQRLRAYGCTDAEGGVDQSRRHA